MASRTTCSAVTSGGNNFHFYTTITAGQPTSGRLHTCISGQYCLVSERNALRDTSFLLTLSHHSTRSSAVDYCDKRVCTGWSKKNEATLHFPKYLENY